ncbi:MAG: MSHA biogenesis protein MshK [Burkholderiales bacterium]|nr:MSHA biogenesis protein MshK [Burkholderiales bacterium]
MARPMIDPARLAPLIAGLGLLLGAAAQAQDLPDPTRPPPALTATERAAAPAGPVLQSVLIAPDRRVAIISGQAVALQGKYGDQTLVRISETEVVLSKGRERQTLKLFPDFEKKSSPLKGRTPGSSKTGATRP